MRQLGGDLDEGDGEAVLATADVGDVRQQDLEALERVPGDRLPCRLAVGLGEGLPEGPEVEPHHSHDPTLVPDVPEVGARASQPLDLGRRRSRLAAELGRQLLPADPGLDHADVQVRLRPLPAVVEAGGVPGLGHVA